MVDPSLFLHTHIDGVNSAVYLPSAFVREQQAALRKSRQTATGRVFSDYARVQSANLSAGLEKPSSGLPFDLLRDMADKSPIDSLILTTRSLQIRRIARIAQGRNGIGFAVRHKRHDDPTFAVPEGIKTLCRDIEEVISHPTAPFHQTMRDFLTCAVEEELTIDRKAMVIARDGRSRPIRYHLVDGATVRQVPTVIFEAMEKQAKPPNGRPLSYSEMAYRLSEQSGWDLTRAAYVQLVDAQIVGAWRDDEMSIDITNPSVRLNQWGYGRSLLERSWSLTDAYLKAWNYNLELFGLNYPEAILAVIGDYDDAGLRAFKRQALGEGDGRQNWRLPVIPFADQEAADLKMIKLRDTPREMMFAEFLDRVIKLKAAAFRIHPSMINATQDGGGAIVFNAQADKETEIEQSQEEGFHSLLDSLADWLTRTIIQEYDSDLVGVWVGLNRESDDAVVTRLTQEVQTYMTINEARKQRNLPPLDKDIPDNPADYIGSYQAAVQMVQGAQQAQQAQQQQAQYDEGDFGGDDGQNHGQPNGQQPPNGQRLPAAPAPQRGGPQHLDEEAQQLRRSHTTKRLTITVDNDG